MAGGATVLIVHDAVELYLTLLEGHHPDIPFVVCRQGESIAAALHRSGASIVFAVHCAGFPKQTHGAALMAEQVRWLQNAGAGIDHLPPWDPARTTVTNASGVLAPFMAETVIGAMIMHNFGFPRYLENRRSRRWSPHPWQSLGMKTLLVIGLGRIGRCVAERAKGFGMRVIGIRTRPSPSPVADAVYASGALPDLLGDADFVTIHVPDAPATRHLVDDGFLARMKPTAFLVNTARGRQVDAAALVAALETGALGGAYLDVFEEEPLPAESPLWEAPNLILSPHKSDAVEGWEVHMAGFFADNLDRWLAGEPLVNLCDPERGY